MDHERTGFIDPASSSHACCWDDPIDHIEPLAPHEMERAAEALSKILDWLARSNRQPDAKLIGTKTLALLWAVRPDLLRGQTAADIASQIGTTRAAFTAHVQAFLDEIGFHAPHLRTDTSKARMAESARRSWVKRHARTAPAPMSAPRPANQNASEAKPGPSFPPPGEPMTGFAASEPIPLAGATRQDAV